MSWPRTHSPKVGRSEIELEQLLDEESPTSATAQTAGRHRRTSIDRTAYFTAVTADGTTAYTRQANDALRRAITMLRAHDAETLIATIVWHDAPRLEHEVLPLHVPEGHEGAQITSGTVCQVIPAHLAAVVDMKAIEDVAVGDRIVDLTSASGRYWHTRIVARITEDPAVGDLPPALALCGPWDGHGFDPLLGDDDLGHRGQRGSLVLVVPHVARLPRMHIHPAGGLRQQLDGAAGRFEAVWDAAPTPG